MLSQVVQAADRGILLVTSEMPPSVLRDYYLEQGICASVVFAITITAEAELIYASLNFGETPDSEAGLDEQTVAQHLAEARSLYRRAEAVRSLAKQGALVWRGQ